MKNPLAPHPPTSDLAPRGPRAVERCPAARFLASCNEASRRTMAYSLIVLARLRWKEDRRAFMPGGVGLLALPWGELRSADVVEIRAALERSGSKAATANRHLVALRGIFGAAFDLGLIDATELERCRRAAKRVKGDDSTPAGRMLEPGELSALLATESPRDRALVSLAIFSGLRRHELAGLDVADVDVETGALRTLGKGRKARRIIVPATAREAVRAWLDVRGRVAGPLFVRQGQGRAKLSGAAPGARRLSVNGVWDVLRRVAARAGVANVTPHDYRRTFASRMLDAGVDVAQVAAMMGHSDPETTRRYDRRGDRGMESAANAYEAALDRDLAALKGGKG